jgi:DNA-binding NtrC family response regulator
MPSPPFDARSVLLVSSQEQDRAALQAILANCGLILHRVHGVGEALDSLAKHNPLVVICERDLPDGDWKALHAALSDVKNPPRLIVSSRLADDRLWAEVLNLGGYDVLMTPFLERETGRVVSAACDSWMREAGGMPEPCPRQFRAAC